MKRLLLVLSATLAASPVQAAASDRATTRLTAIVPAACAIDVESAVLSGGRATITLHRRCNTSHVVTIRAAYDAGMGEVTIGWNGSTTRVRGDAISFSEPELFYDGAATIVIEARDADPARFGRYVEGLTVDIGAS